MVCGLQGRSQKFVGVRLDFGGGFSIDFGHIFITGMDSFGGLNLETSPKCAHGGDIYDEGDGRRPFRQYCFIRYECSNPELKAYSLKTLCEAIRKTMVS